MTINITMTAGYTVAFAMLTKATAELAEGLQQYVPDREERGTVIITALVDALAQFLVVASPSSEAYTENLIRVSSQLDDGYERFSYMRGE
jgi:hypothetical protein